MWITDEFLNAVSITEVQILVSTSAVPSILPPSLPRQVMTFILFTRRRNRFDHVTRVARSGDTQHTSPSTNHFNVAGEDVVM